MGLLHQHAGTHVLPTSVQHDDRQSTGGNQSLVTATATVNLTNGTNSVLDSYSNANVFLSHWDASGAANTHRSALVTVALVGSGTSLARTKLWMIDNTTSAQLLWQSWGSPAVPTSEQISELKAYSEVIPRMVDWKSNGTVTKADVLMPPNSACVIALPR